jgi:putative addiction module killer protein
MFEIYKSVEFTKWIAKLKDRNAVQAVNMRIEFLRLGHLGKHRVLEHKLTELKIDKGPGYRVYVTRLGNQFFVLLAGGDKSTQKSDIKLAQSLVEKDWKDITVNELKEKG